jgi:hypothetical protein
LTKAEENLLRAAALGKPVICGPNDIPQDPANDPSRAENWEMERTIRADLLRWPCVAREAKKLMDPKGIQIFGARVPDALDLSGVTIPFGLTLINCRIFRDIILNATELPDLDLTGTWTSSIHADDARVRGHVFLRDGFHAEGEVRFLQTQIGGNLDCHNATFKSPFRSGFVGSAMALITDGVVVGGSVFISAGFHSEGEVRFLDSEIAHNLECSKGTFSNPSQVGLKEMGTALAAERVRVGASVLLSENFRAEGEVDFTGAKIEGTLDSKNSTFLIRDRYRESWSIYNSLVRVTRIYRLCPILPIVSSKSGHCLFSRIRQFSRPFPHQREIANIHGLFRAFTKFSRRKIAF